MKLLLDAFWRAAAYCLHPKVIVLSLVPLLICGGLAAGLGHFYWDGAVTVVRGMLDGWWPVAAFLTWLEAFLGIGVRGTLAPLIVVALAVPVLVLVSLLLVTWLMTPALVKLVGLRRFPHLERKQGGGFWQSAMWSIGCTVTAMVLLVVSVPLWFVPPLVLILPPLIWGWLTYKVLAFDVVAEHASRAERRELMREHRWPLLGMGVAAGYLGAAPSLVWAVSAAMWVFAPLLVLAAVWIYTLVFAFSALWFAHYLLAALQSLRAAAASVQDRSARLEPAPLLVPLDPATPASGSLPIHPTLPPP